MRKLKFILLQLAIIIIAIGCTEDIEPVTEQKKPEVVLSQHSKDPSNQKINAAIITPYYGTYYSGDVMEIYWDFLLCGCDWTSSSIHIDLYKGNTRIERIASNVNFWDYTYDWIIPSLHELGNDFKIRITNTSSPYQYAESNFFSLVTPSSGCYYSTWRLTGNPGIAFMNTTYQFKIKEIGLTSQALANYPTMIVKSYSPINVVYEGITYYCPGWNGVIIPINDNSANCAANPEIAAPLKFQLIGHSSGNGVTVGINSVTEGHLKNLGQSSFHFSVYE